MSPQEALDTLRVRLMILATEIARPSTPEPMTAEEWAATMGHENEELRAEFNSWNAERDHAGEHVQRLREWAAYSLLFAAVGISLDEVEL